MTTEEAAQDRRSRRWLQPGAWVVGLGSLGLAIWFAVGPWTVTDGGKVVGCGSPFMGRYRVGNPDIAASAFFSCWQQAGFRLFLSCALFVVGIVLVIVAILELSRPARRTR